MHEGKFRKARVNDAKRIHELIAIYAKKEIMLLRSLSEIYETIRDYWVYEEGKKVLGCAALHVDWEDLAEIRSVVVDSQHQKHGIGKKLVKNCIKEARKLGMERIFVLAYETEFFRKIGFSPYNKEALPHKIWNDCIKCPRFPECDEEAMIIYL